MNVAPSDKVATFDVDDTLILWDEDFKHNDANKIEVICPYDGTSSFHVVHEQHLRFMRKLKARGFSIVVWSAAGTFWAEAVVKALGIEDTVDFVMSKPDKVIDDLKTPNQIIPHPLWMENKKGSV